MTNPEPFGRIMSWHWSDVLDSLRLGHIIKSVVEKTRGMLEQDNKLEYKHGIKWISWRNFPPVYLYNLCIVFQVISAQQLPKPDTEKLNSIVDPLVWVETHGAPIDNNKKKTHRIDNNGMSSLLNEHAQ